MTGYDWVSPCHCSGSSVPGYRWVRSSRGRVHPDAVRAGTDVDKGPLYVGRVIYEGDLIPCKISTTLECAYVPYGGREVRVNNYEVLVSKDIAWKPAVGGEIPPEAIKLGQTSIGEPLYSGRAMYDGALTPGKVHPSHNCLYIAYNGEEISFRNYEIMIHI